MSSDDEMAPTARGKSSKLVMDEASDNDDEEESDGEEVRARRTRRVKELEDSSEVG